MPCPTGISPHGIAAASLPGLPSTFGGLQTQINQLFEDFWGGLEPAPATPDSPGMTPEIDVRESPEAYHITAELPGVEETDVDVTVSDGTLSIKGEKKLERETREDDVHLRERSYGTFRRQFQLPPDIEADKISATFRNGVLEITLPKQAEAKAAVRKVEIGKP